MNPRKPLSTSVPRMTIYNVTLSCGQCYMYYQLIDGQLFIKLINKKKRCFNVEQSSGLRVWSCRTVVNTSTLSSMLICCIQLNTAQKTPHSEALSLDKIIKENLHCITLGELTNCHFISLSNALRFFILFKSNCRLILTPFN